MGHTNGRKDGLLTTGEMARQSENTLRTVRFYEESGLLEPAERTEGGHRLFPVSELRKLKLVSMLRAAGFALDDIRDVLGVKGRCRCGAEASRELSERLTQQIAIMNERIDAMKHLLQELESTQVQLTECAECQHSDFFPDACGQCEVMAGDDPLPNALAVLWRVDRE
jgi:MerR family transcriptional regulator, Zn(II)-responsive regulator of zntA